MQIFSVELSLNLFAYWFWPFFTSGWHVFDFGVVTSWHPAQRPTLRTLSLMLDWRVRKMEIEQLGYVRAVLPIRLSN